MQEERKRSAEAAIHALTYPRSTTRADWLDAVNDYELAAYISRYDEDKWTRLSAEYLMAKLNG